MKYAVVVMKYMMMVDIADMIGKMDIVEQVELCKLHIFRLVMPNTDCRMELSLCRPVEIKISK